MKWRGGDQDFSILDINISGMIISVKDVKSDTTLPEKGILKISQRGDIIRIKRREDALSLLASGEAALNSLGAILECEPDFPHEDPRTAIIDYKILERAIGGSASDSQKQAFRMALKTPDIALIQGPPGTGKTKILRALVEQISARSDFSDAILVSSFQHEAVDNAIEGLEIDGIPADRLGGKRGEDRGEEIWRKWKDKKVASLRKDNEAYEQILKFKDRISAFFLNPPDMDKSKQLLRDGIEYLKSAGYPEERLNNLRGSISEIDAFVTPNIGKSFRNDSESCNDYLKKTLVKQKITAEQWATGRGSDRLDDLLNLKSDVDVWALLGKNGALFFNDLCKLKEGISSGEIDKPWEVLAVLVNRMSDFEENNSVHADDGQKKLNLQISDAMNELDSTLDDIAEIGDIGISQAIRRYIEYLESPDIESLRMILWDHLQVRAITCGQVSSVSLGVHEKTFSIVIVDEAARANPLDILIPLIRGRRVILIGDHKQLPHCLEKEIEDAVMSKEAGEEIAKVYKKSLFERLWDFLKEKEDTEKDETKKIARTVMLRTQYRMHPDISAIVSCFYDSPLEDGVTAEDRQNTTGRYGQKALAWLDLNGREQSKGTSWKNKEEAKLIRDELHGILTIEGSFTVGVIAFYAAQADLIEEYLFEGVKGLIESVRSRVQVGTVDSFQGRQFDVVFLSMVRANDRKDPHNRLGFCALPNRLCVAFSRARSVLVAVGSSKCWCGNEKYHCAPVGKLHQFCIDKGFYKRIENT